jgi:hypothetical protein
MKQLRLGAIWHGCSSSSDARQSSILKTLA